MSEKLIMSFLHEKVFDAVIQSNTASNSAVSGIRFSIMCLNQLDADGMVRYFWSAVTGTGRSREFSQLLKDEGFISFEDIQDDFQSKFGRPQ